MTIWRTVSHVQLGNRTNKSWLLHDVCEKRAGKCNEACWVILHLWYFTDYYSLPHDRRRSSGLISTFQHGQNANAKIVATERGLRQRKVLEGIESLRQKHRGMKVLNSFDHVETWKSILNSFFDREGDCNSQWSITNVKLLNRPRYIFPPFFHIRRVIVTIYWCGYQAEHEKQSAILSFLTTAWRRSVKLIETSILNILNLGKDPGKQWKF